MNHHDHYRDCTSCRKARELRTLRPRQRALIAAAVVAVFILSTLTLWQAPA